MQSGTLLTPWSLMSPSEGLRRSAIILKALGCGDGTIKDKISCARRLSAESLIQNAGSKLAHDSIDELLSQPFVDGNFLPESPINLLSKGSVKNCPILLGSNKNEGNVFLISSKTPDYYDFTKKPTINNEKFQRYIKSVFAYYPSYPSNASNATLNAILYRYSNWDNLENTNANYDKLDAAYGDRLVVCPTVDFATAYAKLNHDVYMYRFDQFDRFGVP